jgi:nucleotide-binding universal stress UspA family protein
VEIVRLNRVVIAIDFSERSIAAAQWVARVFAPKSELVLVHALQLPERPRFLGDRFALRAEDVETCRMGARARLRQLGQQIGRGLVWEEIRSGRPDDQVLLVAQDYDADLIVTGSHRDRPGLWNRLGSTADRILNAACVPVLVVHGAPRSVPRSLLVAVDDSEVANTVIERARVLARELGAKGKVAHVLPQGTIDRLLSAGEVNAYDLRVIEAEKQLVEATQNWLETQLGLQDSLTAAVLVGDAAETILHEARKLGSELILLGKERRSSLSRLLLGSVAGAVIRGANCPVLVIPTSKPTEAAERQNAREVNSPEEPVSVGAVS